MHTRLLVPLAIIAISIAPGCKKDKSKKGGGSAAPTTVRAPTADDLVEYTKDLKGDGPLIAKIETSMGTLTCELYEKQTPVTVANFVGLARGLHPWKHPRTGTVHVNKHYFDGLIFHRVMPNNFVQTGDPLGEGAGGPGYTFDAEIRPNLRHDRPGIMSMARPPGKPNANGSQFFITEVPTKWLDGKHTVFGHCDNLPLIKKMTRVEKDGRDRTRTRPKDPITIERVLIQRGKSS